MLWIDAQNQARLLLDKRQVKRYIGPDYITSLTAGQYLACVVRTPGTAPTRPG
jgi:hypothetical protein